MNVELKTVGASGQISLGKKYAGRTVAVEQREDGVWLVRTAKVIPDNELWLHEEPFRSELTAAIEWADTHPAAVSDLEAFERKLRRMKKHGRRRTRSQ